jgi:uncharacterized protein YndB with AHSA1/START domain
MRIPARAVALAVLAWASVAHAESQTVESVIKAPVADVWLVFSTAEGFRKLGVAQCDFDLRLGGLIRTHYDAKGVLGDEGTIHNEILSYEPQRMISIRIKKAPQGFPFAEATWKPTWSVISLTDLGNGQTQVRITGLGYPDTEEGRKMMAFFKTGNAWTLARLQKGFEQAPGERKPER